MPGGATCFNLVIVWAGDNVSLAVFQAEYALQQNLAGVLVWGIETDDFHNMCGKGKFPLITTLKTALEAVSS